MSQQKAKDLLQDIVNRGAKPEQYEFNVGREEWVVIVRPKRQTLTEKRADDQTISFTPTGRCPQCGR